MGFLINPFRFVVAGSDFSSDFETAGDWTNRGTGIDVDNVVADHLASNVGGGSDIGTSQNMGFTLSDTTWVVDTDYTNTDIEVGNAGGAPMFIGQSAAQFDATEQIGLWETGNVNENKLRIMNYTGSGARNDVTYNTILTEGTKYYLRFGRNTATQTRLSIFTNADYTGELGTAVTNDSVSSAIDSLDIIQACNNDGEASSKKRYWQMNNVEVYDGVTTPP
tara:strand:+ start:286 stop:948 length:663 start_codon:yes stop_codon:yes gene_type:complete